MHAAPLTNNPYPLVDVEVFPLFVATRGAQGEVLGYCKGLLSASATKIELEIKGWWHPGQLAPKFELYETLARAVVRAVCQNAEMHPERVSGPELHIALVDARTRKTFPLHLGLLNASVQSCIRDFK